MSDFLSNLVDRSLNRADVIQPRLPSLFEPAQGMGSPLGGLWQQAEPMEFIEQSVTEARNPQAEARQSSPISRIFERIVERRSAESNPNLPAPLSPTAAIEVSQPLVKPIPASAQSGSVDRAEPAPNPANTSVIQPLQPQITAGQIFPGNVSVKQPEIPNQPPLDRERPIERSIDNPDRLAILNPAPIAVQNPTDRVQQSPLTDPPRQNPPRLGQMMESAAMEQIRSAIQAMEPAVVSTPARSPMPTIQVTIGRIEVRATTTAPATPAAPPSRSKSPVMSLDEYLRQRGGGR